MALFIDLLSKDDRMRRIAVTLLLAAACAEGGVAADAPATQKLQSGLKVGEKVSTFYVRAVTGPLKNRSVCYVCRNGDRPVVMLFIRQITPELKELLKGIDREVDRRRAAGLRSFGVFFGGDSKDILPRVQTLAFDEKIELPLTIAAAPSDGAAMAGFHPDAAVTVILYRELTVVETFAYRPSELDRPAIEGVLKAIDRLTED